MTIDMRRLLRSLLLFLQADPKVALADGPRIEISKLGSSRPKLRPEVESVLLSDGYDEPHFAMSLPDQDRQFFLSQGQHEVVTRLDGRTRLDKAVADVISMGLLPQSLDRVMGELYEAGLVWDADGSFAQNLRRGDSARRTEERLRHLSRILWGGDFGRGALIEKLSQPAMRAAHVLMRPAPMAFAVMASILGLGLFIRLLNSTPAAAAQSGESPILALMLFAVASWLFANLCTMIAAAAISNGAGLPFPGCSWRLYFGIPFLCRGKDPLEGIPWVKALRFRLAGLLFLALIGFFLTIYALQLGDPNGRMRLTALVASLYLVCFLQVAPLWSSPLVDSIAQVLHEFRRPGDRWFFMRNRMLPLLFGSQPPTPREMALLGFILYQIAWIIAAGYVSVWAAREGGLVLLKDAMASDTQFVPYFAIFLLVTFGAGVAAAIVSFLALIAIGGLRQFQRLDVWKNPENISAAWVAGGLVLALMVGALPESRTVVIANTCLILISGHAAGLCFRFFRPEYRCAYTPAAAVWIAWFSLSIVTSGINIIRLDELSSSANVTPAWSVFPLAAGIITLWAIFGYAWNPRLGFLASAAAIVAGIAAQAFLRPAAGYAGFLFLAAALVHLGLGAIRGGGLCRWSDALFAVGLALLSIPGLQFAFADSFVAPPGSPIWRGFEVMGFCLLASALKLLRHAQSSDAEEPVPDFPDLGRDESRTLLEGGSRIWTAIQGAAGNFLGTRVADHISTLASSEDMSFVAGASGLKAREAGAAETPRVALDLEQLVETASRHWTSLCGSQMVKLAAERGYLGLPVEVRKIIHLELSADGGFWRALHLAPSAPEQVCDPIQTLRKSPLLSDLPEDVIARILKGMQLARFSPGENVVRQGERGDSMYVIAQGRVRAYEIDTLGREHPRMTFGPGEFFGHLALITNSIRTATIRAVTDLWVYRLQKSDFQGLGANLGATGDSAEAIRKMNRIYGLPLFRGLSLCDLEHLVMKSESIRYDAGAVIIAEGAADRDVFIVDEGKAEAVANGKVIRTLGPGDFFGEIALLFDVPRTVTVRAATGCSCLRIPPDDVKSLAARRPAVYSGLKRTGRSRVESTA